MALPATGDIVSKRTFLERNHRLFRSVDAGALGFERALERYPLPAWGVFTLLYFVWAVLTSNRKQLWFDEVVSYSVDHVPTWSDAWRALQIGVDANPPLFHLANRFLLAVFGDTDFIQRGSSVLGFWVMSLCVYRIVRRNHSAAAAWVAAVIPVCSGAAYYATESRPYGMVLGFVSLGIICWLNAIERMERRSWWLAGLTLSIAAAISSHYYSVFTIAPFLGAEATRMLRRAQRAANGNALADLFKLMDWPVVAALLASFIPLPFFWKAGLMSAANQYTGDTDPASLLAPIAFWGYFLSPILVSIAMAVAIAVAWKWLSGNREVKEFEFAPSDSLLIAAWFCAQPIIVILNARFVTHAYEPRYAITAVLGAAILIAAGFDVLRSFIPGSAGLAVVALLFPVAANNMVGRHHPLGRHVEYSWEKLVAAEPALPLVYPGQLEFVQAWFSAPSQELKRRMIVLADPHEARVRTGSTTADLGVINLAPALPIHVAKYSEFAQQRQPFYIVYEPSTTTWVIQKLIEDGARLRFLGYGGADEVYRVDWE